MDDLIAKLKAEIIRLASDPNFIHNKWFAKYHLEIVEKIALELCGLYPSVNTEVVCALVWIHDYGRFISREKRHEETLSGGSDLLIKLSFPKDVIDKLMQCVKIMDNKLVTDSSPMEAQIVSSADAASHLISPFYSIYFYENSNMSLNEIFESNIKKLHRDWEKKFILPEVRKVLEQRFNFLLEQNGVLPDKLLGS